MYVGENGKFVWIAELPLLDTETLHEVVPQVSISIASSTNV